MPTASISRMSSTVRFNMSHLLLIIFSLSLFLSPVLGALTTSMTVDVVGSQIRVDGKPYFIKGVIYSPSPIGFHPGWTWPHGDFFIAQYEGLWARDFPLLVSLGANTIRVSGWNHDLDHGYFLDRAHKSGLKVIVTFNLGNVWQSPVQEAWQRYAHLGSFSAQFSRYLGHPALLGWAFGEGLNLPGQGYMDAFNSLGMCGWNGADVTQGGCSNDPDPTSGCAGAIACVYTGLFGYINDAAAYAKNIMLTTSAPGQLPHRSHLIFGAISDVDVSWMRTQQFSHLVPALDGWGLQIYRGRTFGEGDADYLSAYETRIQYDARGEKILERKPLVVLEYGIDAYRDPCGSGTQSPCYNDVSSSISTTDGGEDEVAQADWASSLSSILSAHSSASSPPLGSVAGGTINSYVDESWRGTSGVGGCSGPVPYPLPGFDAASCSWKAHVQCPQMDLWKRSICGFPTPATFDGYSNVGWYGLLRPEPVVGDVDRLTPRLVYGKLQQQWNTHTQDDSWMLLLVVAILLALIVAYRTRTAYLYRSAQVDALTSKLYASATVSLSSSAPASASGRSPTLGPGRSSTTLMRSPPTHPNTRVGAERRPAGKSSRATSSKTTPIANNNADTTEDETAPLMKATTAPTRAL